MILIGLNRVVFVCTQDVEVEVSAAIPCTVRGQAAVPASVCNLGPRNLEETAVRQNLVASVRHQQLSILQPFDVRYRVTWKNIR